MFSEFELGLDFEIKLLDRICENINPLSLQKSRNESMRPTSIITNVNITLNHGDVSSVLLAQHR